MNLTDEACRDAKRLRHAELRAHTAEAERAQARAEGERMRKALDSAWSRMDSARNILHTGPDVMWAMLDTTLDRAALAQGDGK
jgi:hypothetical protein